MKNTRRCIELDRQLYKRLAGQLGKIGLVLQGTITERTILREELSCKGNKKIYGPYYQWTRKHRGKTITINLTASQAKAYQKAINNHRKIDKLIRRMRQSSLKILEASTASVQKRKARVNRDLLLS
jgi:hypothetical protein